MKWFNCLLALFVSCYTSAIGVFLFIKELAFGKAYFGSVLFFVVMQYLAAKFFKDEFLPRAKKLWEEKNND